MTLYQNFVAGFAHKINLLKLAFFAVAVSKQMAKPQVGSRGGAARECPASWARRPGQPCVYPFLCTGDHTCAPACATQTHSISPPSLLTLLSAPHTPPSACLPAGGRGVHPRRHLQPGGRQAARHAAAHPVPAHAAGAVRAGAGAAAGGGGTSLGLGRRNSMPR